MVLLVTVLPFLVVVALRGDGDRTLAEVLLGNIAYLVPAGLLLHQAREHPRERWSLIPLALGIAAFALGADLYALDSVVEADLHTGPMTAFAYLVLYPLFLTAILTALGRHLRGLGRIVALDGLTGALAGSAVAAAAVGPLIARVWDGSGTAAFSLLYPLGDVLLVGAALGALSVVGVREGRHFALWTVGMIVFAIGDISFAYYVAVGPDEPPTWFDGVWCVAIALMALGAGALRTPQGQRVPGAESLGVVALSAVAAIVVLVAAPGLSRGPAAGLAVLTLVCCGARFLLAFQQLHELAAVRQLALTDELTGVANRRALYAELDRLLRRSPDQETGSQPPPRFGLVLLDLQHFKEVNDSLGHAAGDDLLRMVVERFDRTLAGLRVPHLLSRLGGDEFAVLLPEAQTAEAATEVGVALLESLQDPVTLDGVQLHVRASIGVAVAPEHGQSRGDILFAVDTAVFAAKTAGDAISVFAPTAVGDRRRRLTVAEDLYSALDRGELVVDYQPQVALRGDIVGVEALVRWDHPSRGRLYPGDFMDVAERYRLTPAIAERVLHLALTDAGRWRTAGRPLRVSVNVSASDLRDDRLVDIVATALAEHGVAPSTLTIEVTESAMMQDPQRARTVMTEIAALGVALSVDDYGTGYSSLEYLLRLPIDEIKLDRAFSADLTVGGRSVAIVRSTIDLTHALGLHMVAEGVEDEQTLVVLRDLGCDVVQGWHLGRPMSAAALEARFGIASPATALPRDVVPR